MKNRPYPLYEISPIRDLKDMLEQKQRGMPDATAFWCPTGHGEAAEKTYGDFYEEVNALGTWEYLQDLHGVHVGILGENSYEWLLAFCSVANGGSVAVPVDRELPEGEIKALLEKADVSAVFVSPSCRRLAEGLTDMAVFPLENMEEYLAEGRKAIAEGNRSYLDFRPDTEKLCCILFTSGTSGSGKGVMLSQGNLAADINASSQLVVLHGNLVALLPFHHAFGLVVGVFMVFHYGRPLYLNQSLRKIPASLSAARPWALFLVPLFIETFHRQIWAAARKEGRDRLLKRWMRISDRLLRWGIDLRKLLFASVRKAFGGELKFIISGGAGLDASYIREFRSWGIEILNGYGTTECSPCAAVNRNRHHKDGTVGLPVAGTGIRIAKDGEVLIRGGHVMLGYYKEEEATAAVLRDGWYATGDLGYLDEEGFLTLTGRKKNLIILSNAENISPEELERDFLADPAVREALVYARDGVITAEIYPEETVVGEIPKEDYFQELMKRVNRGRPSYKQVKRIKLRDEEFEKNTSGKILRRKEET